MSSPICVADNFHFSHFYWRSWDLADTDESDDDNNSNNGDISSGNNSDEGAISIYKPKQLKAEVIKLKFYSQVIEDNSNNIHFGKWDGIEVRTARNDRSVFDFVQGNVPTSLLLLLLLLYTKLTIFPFLLLLLSTDGRTRRLRACRRTNDGLHVRTKILYAKFKFRTNQKYSFFPFSLRN